MKTDYFVLAKTICVEPYSIFPLSEADREERAMDEHDDLLGTQDGENT